MSELTFDHLSEINESRVKRWHPGFPEREGWNGADWSNAMCGEAGEAANVVKKLRRLEENLKGREVETEYVLVSELGDELADVVIYANLLALKYNLDLGTCIEQKFNRTSEEHGFPERL